jgi:hypothetical protein
MTVAGPREQDYVQPEPMKYLDWVQSIFQITGELTRADAQARLMGVRQDELLGRLGVDPFSPGFYESPERFALGHAVIELVQLGLLEPSSASSSMVRLTQEGRRLTGQSLRSIWPEIFTIYLEEEQLAFLRAATDLSEDRQVGYAQVNSVPWQKVFDALGWPSYSTQAYVITAQLQREGCLVVNYGPSDRIDVYPTYRGIVRATEQIQTELQQLVAGLLAEWETTNVEFKRQLDLATKAQKAEFVRDTLALATTKSGGERFLVVGFDDRTRQFVQSVNAAIDQNRLEQLLNAYAAPAPEIRYHRVAWDQGEIGVHQGAAGPGQGPLPGDQDAGPHQRGERLCPARKPGRAAHASRTSGPRRGRASRRLGHSLITSGK